MQSKPFNIHQNGYVLGDLADPLIWAAMWIKTCETHPELQQLQNKLTTVWQNVK